MTATTYKPITITRLTREGWYQDEIASGQGPATAAIGFLGDLLDDDWPDDHPGMIAWDKVVDEVIAEVGPQIRDVIYEGLQRRLPWTWDDR